MSWLQLHIATDPDHADAFQDALEALGAGAVTLTDGALDCRASRATAPAPRTLAGARGGPVGLLVRDDG